MNKWFFVILFAFLLLHKGFSETVFERSLLEMGHESFVVDGQEKEDCLELAFVYPKDIDILGEEIYPIASIGIELGPVGQGEIDVNLNLNGKEIAALGIDDFKCGQSLCWERAEMPKNVLKEENSLRICLGTGNTVTRIVLSNESAIGLYKSADFGADNSFRMEAEKPELVIGEKTKITILLHNQGSAQTFAEIKFARPLAEDKNAFSLVEGEAYFTGVVEAGQTIEISYVIKPRLASKMTLPPAIVYYKNPFGETESKFSNLVHLDVKNPETRVEAFIVKEDGMALIGQPVGMMVAVKNVGLDPLYDLSVEVESEAGSLNEKIGIASIQPKQTKYIPFSVSSMVTGQFSIGCTVRYKDLNGSGPRCQESLVEFAEPEVNPSVYAGLALVLAAVIAYVYITRF